MFINQKVKGISHYLLLISLVLAPFNELRFSFFGISELIILYLFFNSLKDSYSKKKSDKFIFTKFFRIFIIIILTSGTINILFYGGKDVFHNDSFFNLFSYTFTLLTCFIYEKKIFSNKLNGYKLLKHFYFSLSLLLIFLFIFSFFSSNIFGFPLFYFDRFAPLVNNPHKIALVSSVLPFIGLKIIKVERYNIIKRIIIYSMITTIIFITLKSETTKSLMGIFLGMFVYLTFNFFNKKKRVFLFFMLLLIIIIYVLFFDLFGKAINIFNEIDYKEGRSIIYFVGFQKYLESILLGFGPGSHVNFLGVRTDAHQTILTIALQGGALLVIIFINFFKKIINKLLSLDIVFIALLMPILIYILGGDILRSNYIWALLILIYNFDKNTYQ